LTLVFSGLYAHQDGLLSYPVSHNVTNLVGLLAFVCVLRWIRTRSTLLLLATVLVLVAGGLSDPWIVAAYALPLTLMSVVLVVSSEGLQGPRATAPLCVAMLASLIIVETRAFGALAFLPPFDFAVGNRGQIGANVVHVLQDLGGLLNVIPGTASVEPFPALASLLATAALIVAVGRLVPPRSLRRDALLTAFCWTIALSVLGTSCAVMLSEVPARNDAARFLVNVLYLTVVGIAVLLERNWSRASRTLRFASVLAAMLFAVSGVVGTFPLWRSPSITLRDGGANGLLKFLADNELSYGYGSYWGAKANAATWLSRFEIHIRPVVFDARTGAISRVSRAQSSRRWLLPDDVPPDQKYYFVVVKNDGEVCADPDLCVNGVIGQFGPPERRLHYDGAIVLVWSRPLLQSLQDPN
jgi:hypothetical protein